MTSPSEPLEATHGSSADHCVHRNLVDLGSLKKLLELAFRLVGRNVQSRSEDQASLYANDARGYSSLGAPDGAHKDFAIRFQGQYRDNSRRIDENQ
jgi:hypothetical protein